jgi:hypothetical protein
MKGKQEGYMADGGETNLDPYELRQKSSETLLKLSENIRNVTILEDAMARNSEFGNNTTRFFKNTLKICENAKKEFDNIKDKYYKRNYENGGMMAKGGSIPNNYEGKTPEEVWSSWTLEQKNLFLEDHTAEIKRTSGDKIWHKSSARTQTYENLPQYVKDSVIDHVFTGQYAKGGRLSRKQKQLDLNKNGKLDSQDFKMLRAGRKNARKK